MTFTDRKLPRTDCGQADHFFRASCGERDAREILRFVTSEINYYASQVFDTRGTFVLSFNISEHPLAFSSNAFSDPALYCETQN